MTLLFWIWLLLSGLLVVLGLLYLAQEKASRAWEQHEARRRRQWDDALAARRRVPHACGDDPQGQEGGGERGKCSPRVWG